MRLMASGMIARMIQNALNYVDRRLVDHGLRVALILDRMLKAERNSEDEYCTQMVGMAALLHDIGAYRTEEIDRMTAFETGNVWEHSVYGYLFLRELSPLGKYSEVILYHHMRYDNYGEEIDRGIAHLAQLMNVADRADVFMLDHRGRDGDILAWEFDRQKGRKFAPDAVDAMLMLLEGDGLSDLWGQDVPMEPFIAGCRMTEEEEKVYLEMLVHIIDFRSHHTVTHTITTTQIGYQAAGKLNLSCREREQIYYGALLHDLGKVGIPVDILEKPDRLNEEETRIMRTHVEITGKIIDGCVDETIEKIAVRHHEKLNGTGYPMKLRAEELTMSERTVAVADIVSALCGTRSYKKAYPKDKVIDILDNMRKESALDADVVSVIETYFDEIMDEVARITQPVISVYDRIQKEYIILLSVINKKEEQMGGAKAGEYQI